MPIAKQQARKQELLKKHPDHVEGWNGSPEALVSAIGKMRYDKLAEFVELLYLELQRQSINDRKAGRRLLATQLRRAANHFSMAKNELDGAWTISKSHM